LLKYSEKKISLIPIKKNLTVIKKKDNMRYLFKKPLFFALDINNMSVTKPILLVNKKSILNIWVGA